MDDKPWGGRFAAPTDALVEAFTASIEVDKRMYAEDITASKAHARMLARQGIIDAHDLELILKGLDEIQAEIEAAEFAFLPELEDVHMNIERRLIERIGEAGKKLHTARSRNDQVATDMRLYLRRRSKEMDAGLAKLQAALVGLAEHHTDTIMPGFTHLQTAQPVTFGHHLLAYVEMLQRDRGRFADALRRMNYCPLGAAALAGTSFPIDRHMTARELGFAAPCANSLDAVSDRDFVIEMLAAAALCAVHLSRLSEELILWSSDGFAFIELPDAFCTGSSIMPQKKNPDVAELVRGKTGGMIGSLAGMLATMKALPLAYNRDMQEDKRALFTALDELDAALNLFAAMLPAIKVNQEAMLRAAAAGFSTATDLADHLVRAGIGFRDAHAIVGRAVAYCIEHNKTLPELTTKDCAAIDERLTEAMVRMLSVQASITARNHYGGTAPEEVKRQCALWRQRLEQADA